MKTACVLFLAILAAKNSTQSNPQMPAATTADDAVIANAIPGVEPIWVPLRAAVTSEDALRSDIPVSIQMNVKHLEGEQQRVREKAAQNRLKTNSSEAATVDDCGGVSLGNALVERHVQLESLDDLIRNSRDIVAGKVTKIVPGFLVGRPGSLLILESPKRFRSSGDLRGDTVRIYYPYARMTVNGRPVCADPVLTDYVPRIGDSILVFALGAPLDADGTLVHPNPHLELIAEHADGKLHVPEPLQSSLGSGASLKTIVRTVSGQTDRKKGLK